MGVAVLNPHRHQLSLILIVAIIIIHLAYLVNGQVLKALALIWNSTFMAQFFVWNVITGSFIETHSFKLFLTVVGLLKFSPTVEESLGRSSMLFYMLVVTLLSGVITSCAIFCMYVITRYEYLLSLEVHGCWGLVSALAVAAAHSLLQEPLLPIPILGGYKIRHTPMTLVVISGVLYGAGHKAFMTDFPFVCIATYVGWAYLRFFHVHGDGGGSGLAGDVNPAFSLVMFCPPFSRKLLRPVFEFFYQVARLLGLFSDRAGLEAAVGGGEARRAATIVSRDPVAERRILRAKKLLDEKVAKLSHFEEGRSSSPERQRSLLNGLQASPVKAPHTMESPASAGNAASLSSLMTEDVLAKGD